MKKKITIETIASIVTIITILITLSPLIIPYRFSIDINKLNINNYEYLKVDLSDPPNLKILEGQDKEKKFCLENNVEYFDGNYLSIIGNTPFKELTTFKNGIPMYLKFYLVGNFERLQNGGVNFNVEKWYPADVKYVYLSDTAIWETTYRNIYITSIISLFLVIISCLFLVMKKNRKR